MSADLEAIRARDAADNAPGISVPSDSGAQAVRDRRALLRMLQERDDRIAELLSADETVQRQDHE